MIPDMLVVDPTAGNASRRVVYLGVKGERLFAVATDISLNSTGAKAMLVQHSNSFMDVNGDFIAGSVLVYALLMVFI